MMGRERGNDGLAFWSPYPKLGLEYVYRIEGSLARSKGMSSRGRPVIPLSFKEGEEEKLRSIAGSRTLPPIAIRTGEPNPCCRWD